MNIFSWRNSILWVSFIITTQIGVLYLLGQPFLCTCGYIKVWEGVILSIGTSQQLLDWYTFSHIVHGILFYLLTWFFFPRVPAPLRFLIAVGIEVSWEMLENTPWVINEYRKQALSIGYTGDSILNSVSDTFAMIGGFFLARKLPLWSIILLVLLMEIGVGFIARDNLTLNILNFIHQFDFIRAWQSGHA